MKLVEILVCVGCFGLCAIPVTIDYIFFFPDLTYWNYTVIATVFMMMITTWLIPTALRRINNIPSWNELEEKASELSKRLDKLESKKLGDNKPDDIMKEALRLFGDGIRN